MKASEYYKDDDFAAERAAIAKQDAIERERQVALKRQAAERAWLERQTQKARELAAKSHVDEQDGWRLLRQEAELDRAVWWYGNRLAAHEQAAAEQEAIEIGAKPWLASGEAHRGLETKCSPLAIKLESGTATIKGIASTFGGAPDLAGDIIEAGAYINTLREAKAKGGRFIYPLLWQHDPAHPIGGVVDAREERDGLHIEAQIATDTELGQYAHSLIQKGMIAGLSIGYVVRKERYVEGVRHLVDIALQEISAVTFPANQSARITSTGR